MLVEKGKQRVKCDASGCNNIAEFKIVNKRFVFDGSVYLCEKCLNELYGEMGKYIIPKNVKPVYRNGGKNEQTKC